MEQNGEKEVRRLIIGVMSSDMSLGQQNIGMIRVARLFAQKLIRLLWDECIWAMRMAKQPINMVRFLF